MSQQNLIEFLRTIAARADVLDSLKTKSKPEVISAAAGFGLPFTETDFDTLIWDLEVELAEKRGEPFDAQFPLWQTMWGKYYLEFLALDLLPSLESTGITARFTNQSSS